MLAGEVDSWLGEVEDATIAQSDLLEESRLDWWRGRRSPKRTSPISWHRWPEGLCGRSERRSTFSPICCQSWVNLSARTYGHGAFEAPAGSSPARSSPGGRDCLSAMAVRRSDHHEMQTRPPTEPSSPEATTASAGQRIADAHAPERCGPARGCDLATAAPRSGSRCGRWRTVRRRRQESSSAGLSAVNLTLMPLAMRGRSRSLSSSVT